jgi:hypothetical protein
VLPEHSPRDMHASLEDFVFYSRLYYVNLPDDIAEGHDRLPGRGDVGERYYGTVDLGAAK